MGNSGGLEDLALLSVVFAEAAKKYRKPHYLHALKKLHQLAREKNYDRSLQIFSDHNLNPEDDLEFHLEMNAWLALSFIENPVLQIRMKKSSGISSVIFQPSVCGWRTTSGTAKTGISPTDTLPT